MTDVVQKVAKMINDKNHGAKAKTRAIADFSSGDTVGVHVRVREGEKERVQLYKGIVIKIQGKGQTRSFTVRKVSSGIGVERTFPFMSPSLDKVELISKGKVRRSKLYYLRKLRGKAASIESELYSSGKDETPVVVAASTPEEDAEKAAARASKKAAKLAKAAKTAKK